MIVGAASFGIGMGAEGMGLADHAAGAINAAPDATTMVRDAVLSVGATTTSAFPVEQVTELVHGAVEGVGEVVKNACDGAFSLVSGVVTSGGNALGHLYSEPIAELVGIAAGVALIEDGVVMVGEKMKDLCKGPKVKSL